MAHVTRQDLRHTHLHLAAQGLHALAFSSPGGCVLLVLHSSSSSVYKHTPGVLLSICGGKYKVADVCNTHTGGTQTCAGKLFFRLNELLQVRSILERNRHRESVSSLFAGQALRRSMLARREDLVQSKSLVLMHSHIPRRLPEHCHWLSRARRARLAPGARRRQKKRRSM